jgi:hypothetical protein
MTISLIHAEMQQTTYMKTSITLCSIFLTAALLSPRIVEAQATTYVSNLAQTSTGSLVVGSNSWMASLFTTGNNAVGYVLNSIQLGMTDPSGFTVMLYSEVGITGAFPGSSLDTLDGSLNPVTGGIFTYTPASTLTLSPATFYFIVLTAGTAIASGAYDWSLTIPNSYNPSGGWSAGGVAKSSDGSHWLLSSGSPQFAINATPIPEPEVLGLFGLGGLAFLWHRRKAKAV